MTLWPDADVERALLGEILKQGRIPKIPPDVDRILTPELFSDGYRFVARAILDVGRRTGHCDVVHVHEEMTRSGGGLNTVQVLGTLAEAAPVGDVDVAALVRLLGQRSNGKGKTSLILSEGADAFLSGDIKPVEWAIQGIWPVGSSGPLAGPEKVGKTWIAEELEQSLSTATPFLGKYGVKRPFRVLRWEEEDSRDRTRRRGRQVLAGRNRPMPSSEQLRYLVGHGLKIDSAEGLKTIRSEIISFRPEFVIVGNLREIHAKDENRPEMAQVRDAFRTLSRDFGCAFIVLHHFRKTQEGQSKRGSQMLAGSGVWGAWAEAWIYVTPGGTDDVALLEVGSKDASGVGRLVVQRRDVTDGEPLAVDEDGQKVWPVTLSEVDTVGRADESRGKILEAVKIHHKEAGQPATVKILETNTGLSRRTIVARLPELEAAGLVQVVNLHRNTKGYLPRGVDSGA